MRLLSLWLLASTLRIPLSARDVFYPSAGGQTVPIFDKGYLLFVDAGCHLTVYAPSGQLAFEQTLQSPGPTPCGAASAAVDTDGSVAVSIVYATDLGYRAGLLLLNPQGVKTAFLPTQRYVPSHICFDREHTLWSIGWQRTATGDGEEETDYPLVRHFRRDGQQIGTLLPRSLWLHKSGPAPCVSAFGRSPQPKTGSGPS